MIRCTAGNDHETFRFMRIERPVVGINSFRLTTPGADIDAPRIQNKRGFDGRGDATKASRLENSKQRGQA